MWPCHLDTPLAVSLRPCPIIVLPRLCRSQLRIKGARVLELGCGHGLPAIHALLRGASAATFQDYNSEVLESLTWHNVAANLAAGRSETSTAGGGDRPPSSLRVRYVAGDWGGNAAEVLGDSSYDLVLTSEVRRICAACVPNAHRPRCWQVDSPGFVGSQSCLPPLLTFPRYICISKTIYSEASQPRLLSLIRACLARPRGVCLVAAKNYYFGVGGSIHSFRKLVESAGDMEVATVASIRDGTSNVREILQLTFNTS